MYYIFREFLTKVTSFFICQRNIQKKGGRASESDVSLHIDLRGPTFDT